MYAYIGGRNGELWPSSNRVEIHVILLYSLTD